MISWKYFWASVSHSPRPFAGEGGVHDPVGRLELGLALATMVPFRAGRTEQVALPAATLEGDEHRVAWGWASS